MKETDQMSKTDALTERLAALSPERQLLLERMRKERRTSTIQNGVVRREKFADHYPLSFAQESLWFLQQLEPGRHDYNVPAVMRFRGPLHVAALERSLNEIVRRHEILRTTFAVIDGQPSQVIARELSLPLTIEDLRTSAAPNLENEALRRVSEEAQRPFDLKAGPFARAILLRLAKDDHYLVLTAHHIVCDGWSLGIFTRELTALYEGFSTNQQTTLRELPLQYADFAIWQREWIHSEDFDRQFRYWQRRLAGPLPYLELPADRPRPASATFRSGTERFSISKALTEPLGRLNHSEGATLFMTLLTVFKTLLHHYTQQQDIIVGAPVAGRNQGALEELIGFFVNTVVLRTDFSGDPTFKEMLGRVRNVTLEAYDHQDLPFSKVVEMLRPERAFSQTPLVRATFWLQTIPLPPLELPDLKLTPVEVTNGATVYDLSVVIQAEETGGLVGTLTYNADIFEPDTIRGFSENFKNLLEAVATDPQQRVSALSGKLGARKEPAARRAAAASAVQPQRAKVLEPQPTEVIQLWPLTDNQMLMWLGQQLHPQVPIYNEILLVNIEGEIDPNHFREAFQLLVDRTDALRATVHVVDGVPRQVFAEHLPYEMAYLDLSNESQPLEALHELISQRKVVAFDLTKRLFDTILIKISDDRFVWYLCLHHLIVDAWSFSLIYQRLAEIYGQILQGRDTELELPRFRDFIENGQEFRKSEKFAKAASYWEKKLSVKSEPISFYGRTATKDKTDVERLIFDLGKQRTQQIRSISTQPGFAALTQDMSLFNIFIMLVFAYLHRISGNSRLSLGVPLHNRNSKSFKETIGSLIVVSPLRVDFSEGETFTSLVKKVQAELRETLQHSQYVVANPPDHSVYDVMLNYHNVKFGDFCGFPATADMTHAGFSTDMLTIQVQNYNISESIVLEFDFNRYMFAEEQQLVTQHFTRILDAFLEDNNQAIEQVQLLSEEEKPLVIRRGEILERDPKETVFQLFEEQAERTPEAVAVISRQERLSYRELNERANQVAHFLRKRRVGPESVVGLFLDRGIEMLVGVLGVLKAGAAYLPLDVDYPEQRLRLVLEDAQVKVALSQLSVEARLEGQVKVISLDGEREEIEQESRENPAVKVSAENLAYVIYTSGSTGRRKGVMISHGSLLNYTKVACDAFSLTAEDHVMQFASIAFDTAAEEIFPCLARGGQLVLRSSETLESAAIFFRRCHELGITILDLPTAYWHALTEQLPNVDQACFDKLRLVIIGGEKASPQRLRQWQQHLGRRVRLMNTYGPTEATIVTTLCELTGEQSEDAGREVPIGEPIANAETYILDSNLQPVPRGMPGQLYIGGSGLARGYLNAAGLTAEQFIPDAFSTTGGARIYRTGDLACYRPNGQIVFLGRLDRQVKSHGYRIEPGEIEAALLQHPTIREAAVVNITRGASSDLAAFLVSRAGQTPAPTELRQFLQQRLPHYMIPAYFEWLAVLPFTTSGKLDYQALRIREDRRSSIKPGSVSPRTSEEKLIAEIWATLLEIEVDQIGVHDNFFNLGGHSLLGTQLMSRLNNVFQIEIPLRELFEDPTIEGLAIALTRGKAKQVGTEKVDEILADLEDLSEEELDWILANEMSSEDQPG